MTVPFTRASSTAQAALRPQQRTQACTLELRLETLTAPWWRSAVVVLTRMCLPRSWKSPAHLRNPSLLTRGAPVWFEAPQRSRAEV